MLFNHFFRSRWTLGLGTRLFVGLALVVGMTLGLTPAVQAATITVTSTADDLTNNSNCTLREALRAANLNIVVDLCTAGSASGADTISLPAGTYTLTIAGNDDTGSVGDLDLNSNLILSGVGASSSIINANGIDRALDITQSVTVQILNLTLQGGATIANGGAANVRAGATVTITNSILQNNSANAGGGIFNNGGTVNLDNTFVLTNTATTGSGGGVRNDNNGATTIGNDSLIRGNQASSASGGGVANTSGSVTINNSTIGNNISANLGGGVFNDAATTNLSASIIISNTAPNGGGLSNSGGGSVTLDSTNVTGNSTTVGNGGGIRNATGTLTIGNSSTVSNNSATTTGGGLAIVGGTLTMTDSTIGPGNTNTTSTSNGGGLVLITGTVVSLINSAVITNTSQDDGGGIDNEGGTLTLNHTTVSGNTASVGGSVDGNGGGLRNTFGGTTTILGGSRISGNSADAGGGIQNEGGTTRVISSTVGNGNTATLGSGGGINNTSALATVTLLVTNTTVYSNSAATNGGGIDNGSGSASILKIDNSTLSGNSANNGSGGGLRNDSGNTAILANVTIAGNSESGGNGGGLRNGLTATLTIKNSLLVSNIPNNCDNSGTLTSQGYNLKSDSSCNAVFTATGDLTNSTPLVGVLADNGGPARTHALLTGSPAINAGNPANCTDSAGTPFTTDQRGFARPVEGRCDIGAYEYTPVDLAIGKTDGSSTAIPGNAITYTILVTNSGPSPVIGANVADNFPTTLAGMSWTCSTPGGSSCGVASGSGNISATVNLLNGAAATFVASGNLSSTASGMLTNTATVTAPLGYVETNSSNNAATDTDSLTPQADLNISKTDGQTSTVAGTPITYTIVVANGGPSSVTGASVSDTFPSAITGVSWTCTASGGSSCPASGSGNISATVSLAPNGTLTLTATGAIISSTSGLLMNTATVTAPASVTDPISANNSATDSTTVVGQADLSIAKSDGQTSAIPGTAITYTIQVTNTGNADVLGAIVNDAFPATLTGISWTCSASAGSSCPASGSGNISVTVNLLNGGIATFSASGTIANGAGGTLTNTATVTVPAGVTDPNPNNNVAMDTTNLTPQADLVIGKTDGQTTATPGAAITYTIMITNTGPSDVTGATVMDVFSATLTNMSWTCTATGGSSCGAVNGSGMISTTVTLLNGGSATFVATGRIANTASGTLTNTASVFSPIDPNTSNNSATDSDALWYRLFLPTIRR